MTRSKITTRVALLAASIALVGAGGAQPAAAATAAVGAYHSLVIKTTDGSLWAWGYNGNGQLGDNTLNPHTTPQPVSGLTNVVAVAAGVTHSLALKSDATLWAWGYNYYGQLGNGNNTDQGAALFK